MNKEIIERAGEIIRQNTAHNSPEGSEQYCVFALIDADGYPTASTLTAAIKQEMWYEGLKNHFRGPDDPNYCVLRFHTERYNLLVDWKEAQGLYH